MNDSSQCFDNGQAEQPEWISRLDAVPEYLRRKNCWVAWKFKSKGKPGEKRSKMPVNPHTGEAGSSTDPATWGTFEQAIQRALDDNLPGVGFVFVQGAGDVGVDLDGCRDPETGVVEQWALDIVAELNTYTEVSPSGTGLHCIARGALPSGGRRKDRVEMYEQGRFFTFTGKRVHDTPPDVEERTEQLASVHSRVFGKPKAKAKQKPKSGSADEDIIQKACGESAKFKSLWAGDHSSYDSPSEADLALCSLLAGLVGRDAVRIDKLFRRSGLMRPKWDDPRGDSTYGRITLDKALEQAADLEDDGEDEHQKDLLVALGTDPKVVELFHVAQRHEAEAYARILVNGHYETMPVRSPGFSLWLRHAYYEKCRGTPGAQPLNEATALIEAIALFDGEEHEVFLRVAGVDGDIWIDLADAEGRAVRVTKNGWSVVEGKNVTVRFCRKRGMLPLPVPVPGGHIDELRPFLNLPDDHMWFLFAGWLPSAFRPRGPYGIMAIGGEQGSAKSTTSKRTRSLIDPSRAQVRRLPREERDLMIAASNAHLLSFDNLSTIPPAISDALCSLVTGGGYSTRQLYTDSEEKIIDAVRPVMINGIEDVATRPDFLDRCVLITLPPIPEANRREEASEDAKFELARPRIFGAILNALSRALRDVDSVVLTRKPRMMDFAKWCTAAETAYGWKQGTFLDAYMRNRGDAHAIAIEGSSIGQAVLRFMRDKEHWIGTAAKLQAELTKTVPDREARREWPKTPRGVAEALRRISVTLRTLGVDPRMGGRRSGGNRERMIELVRLPDPGRTGDGPGRSASEDRPGKSGPDDPVEADRDCRDGWDGLVATQYVEEAVEEGEEPEAAPEEAEEAEPAWEVGTEPSQQSQPSRNSPGDPEKADFPGRTENGASSRLAADRPSPEGDPSLDDEGVV